MFVIALYTHPFSRENFLMYLGTGYFWIAVMDMVHTILYKGMNIYPMDTVNHAIQFWVANRYVESLLLLTSVFFLTRKVNTLLVFTVYGAIATLVYILILGGDFPDAYIEGEGLTQFKIISEYIICVILVAALINLTVNRQKLKSDLYPFLATSIVMTILAELAFTNYVNVYGPSNLIGHILKLFSFWLIFYSIVRMSMQEPYKSLSKTTSLLTALRDGIPDLIFYKDTKGVYIGCNQAFCNLVGKRSENEIVGVTDFDLFDKERAESFRKSDEALLVNDKTRHDDEWATYPDGREVLLNTIKTPYRNMNGDVIGLIGISRDITERNKAEEAMQTLVSSTAEHVGEDFFKTAVEKIYHWVDADAVILSTIDESRRAVAVGMIADGVFTDSFSYDLKGTPCENVSHAKLCNYPENIIKLFPDDQIFKDMGVESYIGAPATNKSGKVIGVLCALSKKKNHFPASVENVFRIVAARAAVEIERRVIEEQFRQAQKMEAVGTLVGGIAHDFNNTLAGVTGLVHLAKKETVNLPKTFEKLESIEKLSFRAADMIQQLLSFSRKGLIKKKPIAVLSFLNEIVEINKIALPKNIRLHLDVENSDMKIMGDINQLQQVIMNLLNNARDAVKDIKEPEIIIKLDRISSSEQFKLKHPEMSADEYVCIHVIDNGSGVKREEIEHIFEPFFTTKHVGEGTGLGLSMAYGAIQSHDGLITVDSDPGKGSTFKVFLPLLVSDEGGVSVKKEKKKIQGGDETILLVDDDEAVIQTGRKVLESLGYKVLLASDGIAAIEVYKAHSGQINLIILDMIMPGMGGVEAAREIRKISSGAKILFVTGYDFNKKQADLDDCYSDKVLSKPYTINEFSQVIKSILDGD